MAHPFVWVELHTGDTENAKKFYGELLGWKYETFPMGDPPYTMINVGGEGTSGGITASPTEANPRSHWLPYISVDDLGAATAKAKQLGAKIYQENVEVPGMGRFTILTDPTGAEVALWQGAQG